jgi:hypothetical protein
MIDRANPRRCPRCSSSFLVKERSRGVIRAFGLVLGRRRLRCWHCDWSGWSKSSKAVPSVRRLSGLVPVARLVSGASVLTACAALWILVMPRGEGAERPVSPPSPPLLSGGSVVATPTSDRSPLLAEGVWRLAGFDAASIDLWPRDGLLEPQTLLPAATATTVRHRVAAAAAVPVTVTRAGKTPPGSPKATGK